MKQQDEIDEQAKRTIDRLIKDVIRQNRICFKSQTLSSYKITQEQIDQMERLNQMTIHPIIKHLLLKWGDQIQISPNYYIRLLSLSGFPKLHEMAFLQNYDAVNCVSYTYTIDPEGQIRRRIYLPWHSDFIYPRYETDIAYSSLTELLKQYIKEIKRGKYYYHYVVDPTKLVFPVDPRYHWTVDKWWMAYLIQKTYRQRFDRDRLKTSMKRIKMINHQLDWLPVKRAASTGEIYYRGGRKVQEIEQSFEERKIKMVNCDQTSTDNPNCS